MAKKIRIPKVIVKIRGTKGFIIRNNFRGKSKVKGQGRV
jgi:hypothetical protein